MCTWQLYLADCQFQIVNIYLEGAFGDHQGKLYVTAALHEQPRTASQHGVANIHI